LELSAKPRSVRQYEQVGLWDAVGREHVLAAAREYDELGQTRFLEKYGFGPARAYQLIIDGRSYDSKATLGAAHAYATGRPLSWRAFNGGIGHNGAAWALQRLGFEVAKTADTAVTRQRAAPSAYKSQDPTQPAPSTALHRTPDVVLVGCVKTKQSTAAPARELYTSTLFAKRRRYAEATGRPWYILSALHGLVDPNQVLEPYDMYLAGQTHSYRRQWATRVVRDLVSAVGPLDGYVVEIHAGASYVDPLDPVLNAAGAHPLAPLRGLTQGQHLAWYRTQADVPTTGNAVDLDAEADQAIMVLTGTDPAQASTFPWARTDLHSPGLYAWWATPSGAIDLGLTPAGPHTLIYTGQAGATRWPSGARSAATLFSRINGQHLAGRISSSTLRQTFAALLRDRLGLKLESPGVLTLDSEQRLTDWMREQLSASVWPTQDADHLRDIENRVILRLDAPLNLAGAGATGLRARLTAGRRALHLAVPG
jgi:hypothetical protein